VTPRLWLLLGAFFAVMGGICYAYIRLARWGYRARDEMLAALPRLVIMRKGGTIDE
jgi:hypothetical protein